MPLSPRKRAQRIRLVQYAVLAVLVVAALLATDWSNVGEKLFDPDVLKQLWPEIITVGMKNTLIYTACAFTFGLALGLVLALMRLSTVAAYRWLATGIIEFFRGVPALVVFIGFAYGLPIAFAVEAPGGTVGTVTLALGLVGGAYMAETIRAGIQAVPKGQLEAARSLGMTQGQAMRKVVVPQAFRIILPPLTNELILLTKDSSLVYVLGLSTAQYELTKFGREKLNTLVSLAPLMGIAFCYLLITIPLSIVVRRLESRAERSR